jgi:hypothetical protein
VSWRKYQPRIAIGRLVFIDETWTKTNMAPLRGWCRKGQRLVAHVPHGHWKTTTFVAALRHDRIDAPCVFDGPINGESFLNYVEQTLAPTLKPDDIVIMDNLGSHKSDAVRAAISGTGARLFFLPPYRARTSIQSSRPSQNSNTPCAKPKSAPLKPSGNVSEHSSQPSQKKNQKLLHQCWMDRPNVITL